MNRITTDHPSDNIETALNLFYIKNAVEKGFIDAQPDRRLIADVDLQAVHFHDFTEVVDAKG